MDILFVILSVIFLLVGMVGVIVPILPGVPMCWLGLLMLKFAPSFRDEISWTTLIVLGVIALVITVLDNFLPMWGTKQMGGNKAVVGGATIGLIVGLFFGLLGIIFGPFIGAFIGGIVSGSKVLSATKHAVGAFIGFMAGMMLKFGMVVVILFFYVRVFL